MQKLSISTELSVPLDVASQAVAVLGIRGAGKTNTATVIAEELLSKGQPVVYIDPTDGAWGLRSDYPVFIFGGTHGDLPLQETDGKILAEFVVTEQVPVILSLRHLRKNAQRRFVTDFCEEIYHLKGKPENRTPLTVFIDEAPLFVPQKVMGETARTVGAVEDLIARGRNAGFGVVLISQRSATINKDVLTQCDTIITHRLTSPQDRKALSDWIEENATIEKQKEVLQSLAMMPNGRAWIWSPRLDLMKQVQIRLRKTFDSSATPKRGEKPAQPKRLEEVDLGKLKDKLAASVQKAQQDDPKHLRKENADLRAKNAALERELAKPRELAVDTQALDRERTRGKIEGYGAAIMALQPMVDRMQTLRTALDEQLGDLIEDLRKWRERHQGAVPPATGRTERTASTSSRRVAAKARTAPSMRPTGGNGSAGNATMPVDLPKGERAMLIALAQHREGCTREQLSVLTGYKRSTRDAYLQRLSDRGFVTAHRDAGIVATDAGITALGADYDPLPIGRELLEHWLKRLPAGESALLGLIVQKYPQPTNRDWLSEQSGYQRSSRDAYIQRLRSRKLIEVVGRGEVRASETLFDQ